MPIVDPLLLTASRVSTFDGEELLTNASGFFFGREGRLFFVTSRHVVFDQPSGHKPDRIELELHTNAEDMAKSAAFSILLYEDEKPVWRQAVDSAGEIDVAVIEIDREVFPAEAAYRAFTPEHLLDELGEIEIGTPLLVVGFPLGFHDTLHHMPVARQAIVSSSFGLRFQGQGYFLTDARTHRGISGAPVVHRLAEPEASLRELPWRLLGIHSARLDVGTRDLELDEALGHNCSWYADVLMTLTEES